MRMVTRHSIPAVVCGLSIAVGVTLQAMDAVRVETRTDLATRIYGVTGKGVTIAILDRGIDWTHPDFIKPDGTTRIKWILDMTGQNLCAASNPRPVEYTEAQINAALRGGPTTNTRDAVGHGTNTAGVAAGNGRAFANGKYAGIAPESDLPIVKKTSDGVPAHDGEPAEARFVACIDQAFDWLDQKVAQLGQPVVGLMNSGTQWGPMDGTSAISRKIDQVFGLDRPGRVFLSASGDEGALPNHAGGAYTSGPETIVRFSKNSDPAWLSMWYTGSAPAQVTIVMDNGTIVGPNMPGSNCSNANGIQICQYQPGGAFYPWTSPNGARSVWFSITGNSGTGSLRIRGTTTNPGRFDLYGGFVAASAFSFTDHLVSGRLTDYSTTLSAIVVGAHVMRDSWTDIDGRTYRLRGEGLAGQLWTGSSGGPTRDGRRGIDVTAPGQNIVAAYGRRSYSTRSGCRDLLAQGGGGWYGHFSAASGAAPILQGSIALMLQLNPQLTGRQARQIIQQTGRSDSSTGPTPNFNWGYGKLDVLSALDAVRTMGEVNGIPKVNRWPVLRP